MINVANLKGADIFRDRNGGLWRVTALYTAPTVQMERIDWLPPAHNPNALSSWPLPAPSRPTQFGCADAPIWEGFELLEPSK